MEENFNPVAQSRANYYTPGSPVQFVRVELLKGDQSGDNAVCLTFKNIGENVITGLDVRFKCKGGDGALLCEDSFNYEGIEVRRGELFGMDDAVFVTSDAIGSVDVQLECVYSGNLKMNLREKKRVRLPAPKRLPAEMSARLEQKIGRKGLKFVPQVLENGWYCACGAFHPSEEDTVYCSECGGDRILMQNALSSILQPAQEKPVQPTEEPTRIAGSAHAAGGANAGYTREFGQEKPAQAPEGWQVSNAPQGRTPSAAERFAENYAADEARRYEDYDRDDEETEDPRDARAEAIIRWVPALTVLICAAIILGGFLYCKLAL